MRSRIQGNFLGQLPERTSIQPFRGPRDTLAAMARLAHGPRGEQSFRVRQFGEMVTRHIQPKDYLGEILAVRNVFLQPSPFVSLTGGNSRLIRYQNDPRHVEWIKDPQRLVEEIHQFGNSVADCLPEGTLLLTRDFRFVPIEAVAPGTEIWGHDGWTRVKATAYKGVQPVSAVRMNNGSTVVATADHYFSVRLCNKHAEGSRVKPCACSGRRIEKMRLRDLQHKMVLTTPKRLEFGSKEMSHEQALVEGYYLADGWHGQCGFDISGRDGYPKEDQKRKVQELCAILGHKTSWRYKSIYVSAGKAWMDRIRAMGARAPNERALSIDLGEAAAAGLLRGIMADSGRNTGAPATSRTFTTTSRVLMLQTRILHKMFGVTCGYSYIENHGGLGRHPIWRLSTRTAPRLLRVKKIFHDIGEMPVYDAETESGYIYLPEHDVTVHNCDELSLLGATMQLQLGREVEFVALGFSPGSLTHVGYRVKEPKSNTWIWVDPVAGPREREAAATAVEVLPWSLD